MANHPNNDVVFQIVLGKSNKLIATGGLYNNVGIFQAHPKFKEFSPWVALLYTDAESRNMGFGRELLGKIEEIAKEKGFKKLYLFTFTAESLYIRAGWRELERVEYKGHDTAVMEKTI